MTDAWNPTQYERFKNERSQPFFDLLATLKPTAEAPHVVDLGCGTGELTALLHRHIQAEDTIGLDSSAAMLDKAKTSLSLGLTFEKAEIKGWASTAASRPVDIVFSNAALQWVPDHVPLFTMLREALTSGGQLAIQMPMNHDYPTHVIANQMSREEPWASKLKASQNPATQQATMLTPEAYASLLFKLGFSEQDVTLKVYGHRLESREGVIEWVKGTMLTQFESQLSEADYEVFLREFRARLFRELPDERPFFYPFKRVLIWARR